MAKTKITKIDTVGDFFIGNGDILGFLPLVLATAGIADLDGAFSFGDIKTGTAKWTGNAPTLTPFNNEQGETVYSLPVNGTYGFEFQVMSTSPAMQAKLLGSVAIVETFAVGDIVDVTGSVTGFSASKPLYCPIAVVNTDKNKMFVFPNATVVSQLIDDGGNAAIKCIVTANKVDTTDLKTVTFVKGILNY